MMETAMETVCLEDEVAAGHETHNTCWMDDSKILGPGARIQNRNAGFRPGVAAETNLAKLYFLFLVHFPGSVWVPDLVASSHLLPQL